MPPDSDISKKIGSTSPRTTTTPLIKANPNTPKTDSVNVGLYNPKKGEAARPPPSQFKRTDRCRPPVSGALASHGLAPQYSRRDGA